MKKYKGHIKFYLFTNSLKFSVNVCKLVQTLNLGAFCRMMEGTLKLLQRIGYLPFQIVV